MTPPLDDNRFTGFDRQLVDPPPIPHPPLPLPSPSPLLLIAYPNLTHARGAGARRARGRGRAIGGGGPVSGVATAAPRRAEWGHTGAPEPGAVGPGRGARGGKMLAEIRVCPGGAFGGPNRTPATNATPT